MRGFGQIAGSGLEAILWHRTRSVSTIACLTLLLIPYLLSLGIAQGVRDQAEDSLRAGPDLYVSREVAGRPGLLPVELASRIAAIDGVEWAEPRLVGNIALGSNHEPAVLVGMTPEHLRRVADEQPGAVAYFGRMAEPSAGPQLVIGSQLAERLRLAPGDRIPPFYQNPRGERVSEVVGVFHEDGPVWQAHVILTTLDQAALILNQSGQASDILVACRTGYSEGVRREILRELRATPEFAAENAGSPRVVSREQLLSLVPDNLARRDGLFYSQYLLALLVGVLTILSTAGFGQAERRREVGILKAIGWQTDEILWRSLVESTVLGVLATGLSVVVAWGWMRGANGYLIAGLFLPGLDLGTGVRVPFALNLLAALTALTIALTLVWVGSMYSTWRAAIVTPRDALR